MSLKKGTARQSIMKGSLNRKRVSQSSDKTQNHASFDHNHLTPDVPYPSEQHKVQNHHFTDAQLEFLRPPSESRTAYLNETDRLEFKFSPANNCYMRTHIEDSYNHPHTGAVTMQRVEI